MLRLLNLSNGNELAAEIREAKSFLTRLKGLMLTDSLPEGNGLYIEPCRSIHTFFMNYSIDVLYLDNKNQVVGLDEMLEPGKIGRHYKGTFSVVELPSGTIRSTGTKVGDEIKLLN